MKHKLGLNIKIKDVEWAIKVCEDAKTRDDLVKRSAESAKKIGLTAVLYHYMPLLNYRSKKVRFLETPNEREWTRYVVKHYANTPDPVQKFCMETGRAIHTKDLMLEESMQNSEAQDFIKTSLKYFGKGIAVPVFGPHHSRSIFCFTLKDQDCIPNKRDLFLLQQMCFHFHIRFSELSDVLSRQISLTKREKEVLHLLPLGHSNRKIAEVLGISQSTVNDHVRNLLLKLDAKDRLTVTLRAYILHLI